MTFSLAVKNFPRSVKTVDVKKFFSGVKISFIKLDNYGKGHIEVKNEENLKEALKKDSTQFKERLISVQLIQKSDTTDEKDTKNRPKFPVADVNKLIEKIEDTGRLYIRNLSFDVTEADVVELFKEFGELVEVSLPYDMNLKRTKAFGFVTFMLPKDAVKAFKALDKTKFKGRYIHILPGEEKPEGQKCKGVLENADDPDNKTTFKDEQKEELKAKASSGHNWNALFVNSDAVAQYLADNLRISKSQLFSDGVKGSVSVQLALAEVKLVGETQDFLLGNGVRLDALERITNRGVKSKGDVNVSFALSSTTFIVKNLTPGVTKADLETVFHKYNGLKEVLLPPYGVTAIITYDLSQHAKIAYQNCAYMEFQDSVMMLQWAPLDLFSGPLVGTDAKVTESPIPINTKAELVELTKSERKIRKRELKNLEHENAKKPKLAVEDVNNVELKPTVVESNPIAEVDERTTKIVVKNIPFQATLGELEELFGKFPGVAAVRMPKKTTGGHKGYAFVEFETKDDAQIVMDGMSISTHLLGRRLVMMYSNTA